MYLSDKLSPELRELIRKESTNWQPAKQALMLGMMAIFFVIQLLRGSGREPSLIGATRCSGWDWTLFCVLLLSSLVMTIVSVVIQRRDYEYKKSLDYYFVPGDFKCTTRNAVKLPLYGCLIGFITALSGIGPGVMTNAVLLKLNVHPRVASETGQLLGVYIAYGATISMLIYGQVKLDYSHVCNFMTLLGTFVGIFLQNELRRFAGGSDRYAVLIMALAVLVILFGSSSLTILSIAQNQAQGINVLKFDSYC